MKAKTVACLFLTILLCMPFLISSGESSSLSEAQSLAYNEAILTQGVLCQGCWKWMPPEIAWERHPTLPLPKSYKGCALECCLIALSTAGIHMEPEEIVTLPDGPENISLIIASYSDGATTYGLQFNVGFVNDRSAYRKEKVGERGFLLWDAKSDRIVGIGLQEKELSLYLWDREAGESILADDVPLPTRLSGTTQATQENALALLADPGVTQLFEALVAFVRPT